MVMTELTIEDAVGRARKRFRQSDERLARALAGSACGLPWMAFGLLAALIGSLLLMGAFSLPADATHVTSIPLLVLGGAFLGHGLPLWSRDRREVKRRTREWRHALEVLRLRERQAAQDPALTVEGLERVDRRQLFPISGRNSRTRATTKYVQ